MAQTKSSTAVLTPSLGLRFDKPAVALPPAALQDGMNFRIKEGRLNNLNLGWDRFGDFTLDGPVVLIENFFSTQVGEKLIFADPANLYEYDEGTEDIFYLNPIYATGTASASGTAVTGVGTNWDPEVKAGDFIHFGSATFRDPTGVWFEVLTRNSDTSLTLTASAGTIGSGTYTVRKAFTGAIHDKWTTATFVNAQPDNTDLIFLSNGVDDVVKWNGSDDQVTVLPEATINATKVKVLFVSNNMMVYFNFVQGGTLFPTSLLNSAQGSPADTVSGLASQAVINSGSSEIVAVEALGDVMVAYTASNLTLIQFIGDPVVWIFRQAVAGVGLESPGAIADFGDYHTFLGADSRYTFDGVHLEESNAHVWREILRIKDPARADLGITHFDEENGDLIWAVTLTTDAGAGDEDAAASTAFTSHYLEDAGPNEKDPHSRREFPFSAGGYYERTDALTWADLVDTWDTLTFRWNDRFFSLAFPLNLVGDTAGKIYTLNTQQNRDDDTGLPSFVRFARRATADGRMRGLISRIYPFASQFTTPLRCTLRMSDHAIGPHTITDVQTFDQNLPEGGHFVTHYRRGRFWDEEFGTLGPNEPYEISGFDVDVRTGGNR